MQMMIETPETDFLKVMVTETDKPLRDLVDSIEDGEIISVSLEGMVLSNGQKTE